MNFEQLISVRQSVRGYSSRPVSRELIDKCLDAARLAPSACNSQPWEFIVVDDIPTRDMLVNKALSGIYSIH